MSIISMLLILGAVHGILLALFLLSGRSEARFANRYLAALVFVFSLNLFDTDLFIDEFVSHGDLFQILIWPREFLYGPLIYLYVRELIFPRKNALQGRQLLHFVPALLQITLTWSLLLLDDERVLAIATGNSDSIFYAIWGFIKGGFEDLVGVLHAGLYLFLSLRLLHQHRRFLQNNYSYIDKINLNWLRFIVTATGCIWLIWVVAELIFDSELIFVLIDFCLVVLIYSMGYAGLKHPVIYNQMVINEDAKNGDKAIDDASNIISNDALEKSSEPTVNKAEKYQKSALSFEQSKQFLGELEQLMVEKQFYLDSQLSLPKLAEHLRLSPNYLSQIINEQKQQSFFDYINSYRIEYAKQRLLDPENPSDKIISIAMDAGFNSKSSFYTAFRKETGLTPGKFRASEGQS